MTTEHRTNDLLRRSRLCDLTSEETRGLWHRKNEAALVFVERRFRVTLCHAYPSYHFPEQGLGVELCGHGIQSAWATYIESDYPGHHQWPRPCIVHPERHRFLERVSCRKQCRHTRSGYRCTIEPLAGTAELWNKRRRVGEWEGYSVAAFQLLPVDAEALAALCERRELVFDGRTKLAKAGGA